MSATMKKKNQELKFSQIYVVCVSDERRLKQKNNGKEMQQQN